MKALLKTRRLLILCLAGGLGLFLVFSIPALAQITVSAPQILDATDFTTPGAWQDNRFGDCFYLLPGPVVPGNNESVGPDFFSGSPGQYTPNTCFGAGDPTIDVLFPGNIDWRIFRGDPDDEAFAFTAAPTPADDIQEKAKQNPGCLAGGVVNGPRGTTWDDGDNFNPEVGGVQPPMASVLKLDFNGRLTLAYYFVNGEAPVFGGIKFEECRTQDFILSVFPSVGVPVTRTGTVGEFSMGKYVVFELDGLEGETLLRFETAPSAQDLCTPVLGTKCTPPPDGNFPNCDYAPAENEVLSGVFISDCVGDEDGDGVLDNVDVCPGTVIPESVPTKRLGTNRFALVDGDTTFDTKAPKGKGPRKAYMIEDTAGCSCEQIIEELDLGKGHTKFGCSISAMDEWVEMVTP